MIFISFYMKNNYVLTLNANLKNGIHVNVLHNVYLSVMNCHVITTSSVSMLSATFCMVWLVFCVHAFHPLSWTTQSSHTSLAQSVISVYHDVTWQAKATCPVIKGQLCPVGENNTLKSWPVTYVELYVVFTADVTEAERWPWIHADIKARPTRTYASGNSKETEKLI